MSAIQEYDRALANGADEWSVRTGRSKANIALQRFDRAESDIARLIEMKPNLLETRLTLAEVREQADDNKGAEAALAAVPFGADNLPLADGFADRLEAAELLATAYSHLDRWDKTLELTQVCLKKQPDRISSQVLLGKTLHATRKFAQAVPYLEIGIKHAPKNAELHYLLGTSYQGRGAKGDLDRASVQFQEAVILDNKHGAATLAVAREAERRKSYGAAAFAYERAYKLGMEGPQLMLASSEMIRRAGHKEEAWYRKGLYYESIGRPSLAMAEYENLARLHDSCRSGYIHMARAASLMGKHDLALKYLHLAEQKAPARSRELFWSIVDVMGQSKQDGPRIAMLEKVASQKGRDGEEAAFQLAKLNDAAGKQDQAEKWFTVCVQAQPNDPVFHLELGRLLLTQRGDPARLNQAVKELETAVRLAPENHDAVYGLGTAYFYSNRLDEAILTLRHAVDLQPENGEGYQVLSRALAQAGNKADAADILSLFRRYEEYSQTKETLAARCKRDPTNPELQLRLAEFHMWAHEYAAAIERYHKALYLKPDSRPARQRLAEALGYLGRREQQKMVLAGLTVGNDVVDEGK